MKKTSAALLLAAAATLAGCGGTTNTNNSSTVGNAGNNANLKGANTNTGYVTNTETNAKPTIPANATNIQPPSMGNSNNSNRNSNSNSNKH